MIKITISFDKFLQLQWPRENIFSEDHSLLNTFLVSSLKSVIFFPSCIKRVLFNGVICTTKLLKTRFDFILLFFVIPKALVLKHTQIKVL